MIAELDGVPGVCIPNIVLFPGDPAVRVAAAAAHLRPLHAPRLAHPHPHQVGARGSGAGNGTLRNSTVPVEGRFRGFLDPVGSLVSTLLVSCCGLWVTLLSKLVNFECVRVLKSVRLEELNIGRV